MGKLSSCMRKEAFDHMMKSVQRSQTKTQTPSQNLLKNPAPTSISQSQSQNLFKNPPPSVPESQPENPPLRSQPNNKLIPMKKPPIATKKNKPKTLKTQEQSPPSSPNPISPFVFHTPDLSKAKTRFDFIISRYPQLPHDRLCNALLRSFSDVSTTLQDSFSFLYHMTQTLPSFTPDHTTYHILLAQSCKSPDSTLSTVRGILDLMVTHGCPPLPTHTTDVAVVSLCSVEREDDAVDLVKELSLKYGAPDIRTYNFLVKRLCKCRTVSSVHNFIAEMRESFQLVPDLNTYVILIDNICNSKNLREATRLVGVLGHCGFKPDCQMYNTIMKGYCKLDEGSQVIDVYNKMMDEGVEPDIVTYNTLVYGLSKSGWVEEAKKFMGVMAEKGCFPDEITYTSLMSGLCRQRNVLGAMELLGEMEAKGCSPYECTYSTLLHGLCKSKLLDRGMELFGAMKVYDMVLDAASYAILVRTLCRAGRIAEAYEVFDYAVESKSLKDVAAYVTLESTLKWLERDRERGLAV